MSRGRHALSMASPSSRCGPSRFVVRAAAFGDEEEEEGEGEKSAKRDRGAREFTRKKSDDGILEEVVQVARVTKVVKGGKQMAFRAVVVVGDKAGNVGVGVAKAKEVMTAVQKAVTDGKKSMISVPLTKSKSLPHKIDGIAGSAKVMLRPAAEGTGVIAGGAVRAVLELAGVENCFGKQLGSGNPLNNARAVIHGLANLQTFDAVAAKRGLTVPELWD